VLVDFHIHPLNQSTLRAYGLAVVVTTAAVVLTRWAWPFFAATPYAPVFGAVAVASHWGSGPAGLLAIAIGFAGAFLAFPTTGPSPWHWQTSLGFLLIGFIGSRLIAGRKRAVAALRKSEAELRASLDQVHASEERLRQAHKMEAVGQLAAGVAHNFNNLLTITMGYTDVLKDPTCDDALERSAIHEIRKATERGAALTRQLLAFSRKHDAKIARVDVAAAMRQLQRMLASLVREDTALTFALPAKPATVMVDPHDFEQIALNLVMNARDALPSGGEIHVEIARDTIAAGDRRFEGAAPGDYVCLRVRDNGAGMTAEVRSHLFEPFFTTKEVGEGTGLGLAFVEGIARHAGGFTDVKTAPGEGTTMSVYFPAASPASLPPREPGADAAPSVSVRPASILLVEDEDGVRVMTAHILRRAGYRVLSAASPREAIALFASYADDVDLLLTDVVMPEMHGPALAEQLLARRPDLPVLFVSGYSDMMPSRPASAARVAFLPKPFASGDLVSSVAALLIPAPDAT